MAFEPTPWLIGGGVLHSADVARSFAYAATRGAEGVAGVTDLRCGALPVPADKVRLLPGGGLINNRYVDAGESYTFRAPTATDVQITPTGSSGGRTDVIVARIIDPQYETLNSPGPDIQYIYPYVIEGVPAGITNIKTLGLTYPAIQIAKVIIPANTATITAAMITDMRRIAQPRRERAMVVRYPNQALNIPTAAYGPFPLRESEYLQVLVPEWATRVDVVAHVSGVKYTKGNGTADTVAGTRTIFGPGTPAENSILIQDAEDSGGRYHYTWIGTHAVSEAMRGTVQPIGLIAVRSSGTGNWSVDNQTSVVVDYEFSEGAS